MTPFDWTPYFGGYSVEALIGAAASGVAALSGVLVLRISLRFALDVIGAVREVVG
jgi:hypothetical protein